MYVWLCERPGCRGKTTGSSLLRWLKLHPIGVVRPVREERRGLERSCDPRRCRREGGRGKPGDRYRDRQRDRERDPTQHCRHSGCPSVAAATRGRAQARRPSTAPKSAVPPRRLCERTAVREKRRDTRLAASRVVTVDEVAERIEREMLRDRHPERELPRTDRQPLPRLVERETEGGAVDDMDREPCRTPARPACHALAEHGHVRVVASEHALVERLLRRPGGCRHGTGCRRAKSIGHHWMVTARADRQTSKVARSIRSPVMSAGRLEELRERALGIGGRSGRLVRRALPEATPRRDRAHHSAGRRRLGIPLLGRRRARRGATPVGVRPRLARQPRDLRSHEELRVPQDSSASSHPRHSRAADGRARRARRVERRDPLVAAGAARGGRFRPAGASMALVRGLRGGRRRVRRARGVVRPDGADLPSGSCEPSTS